MTIKANKKSVAITATPELSEVDTMSEKKTIKQLKNNAEEIQNLLDCIGDYCTDLENTDISTMLYEVINIFDTKDAKCITFKLPDRLSLILDAIEKANEKNQELLKKLED